MYWWILGPVLGLIAIFLIYLFLIAPTKIKKEKMTPFCRPYAHRGLWGERAPENSLTAFRLAAEAGFAIELDVHLTKDGEVVVFHDNTLARMCGVYGVVEEKTYAELQQYRLDGTDERIPLLREVLETVAGRVPFLIELKGENTNTALCPATVSVLRGYEGPWCVESFNPILLRWFKKNAPHVVRGFLSSDFTGGKREGSKILNFALTTLLTDVLCRPNFHAWDKNYPKRLGLRICIGLFGATSMVYTVKDNAAYLSYIKTGTYPIFDSFRPE